MLSAFVSTAFCPLRQSHFLPRNVCGRGPALLSKLQSKQVRRVLRCCVESPEWKRGPVDVDFAKEEKLQILEENLDRALEGEDFALASKLRDELMRLQSGAYVSVLSANLKFYNAFSAGSIVDMAGCWLQDAGATCKHPLGPLCQGYVPIINSFGYVFSLGVPHIVVKNVRITMRGSAAWVTCDEHSKMFEEDNRPRKNENYDSRPAAVVMAAINIFVKRNGQWYLTHHSAQPIYQPRE